MGDCITFRDADVIRMNGKIISADYEEQERKLVVLIETGETRFLSIYDAAHGTNDMTRDSYGRNDWNFAIKLDNYYVERKTITQ